MVTPFNYRMHMAGDKWKVVDIYLNGTISQLALKRADFSSTVASSAPKAWSRNQRARRHANGRRVSAAS